MCEAATKKTRQEQVSCLKMGMGQNPVPLVNPKIAGKWMFIPLKMVLIGIDPYPDVPIIGFLDQLWWVTTTYYDLWNWKSITDY